MMKKPRRFVLWMLPLALLLAGVYIFYPVAARSWEKQRREAAQSEFTPETEDWHEQAEVFDQNKATAAAILTGATKIEAYRFFSQDEKKPLGEIGDLPFYHKTVVQEPSFKMRLATLLLDAKSYIIPGRDGKLCILEPTAGFRVWQDQKFVDVVICFSCNQLLVIENNPQVPMSSIGNFRARFYVGGDFDSVRPQLLALVKEAMPDDALIQNL